MAYITSRILKPFYDKINELYSQYLFGPDYTQLSIETNYSFCKLCNANKFFRFVHKVSEAHYKSLDVIAEQLVDVFFPPGILLMKETKYSNFKLYGHCIFCNILIPNFFLNVNIHLNDPYHQMKLNAYKMKFEACNFSAIYEACFPDTEDEVNGIVKKMICIGMTIAKDGEIACHFHKFRMTNEEQFRTHIKDPNHITWIINQLCTAADSIELHRGVTMKNNGFFCLNCSHPFGCGLAGANEISIHLDICCPVVDNVSPPQEEDNNSMEQADNKGSSSSGEEEVSSELSECGSSTSIVRYVKLFHDYLEQLRDGFPSSEEESSSHFADDEYTETSENDPSTSE